MTTDAQERGRRYREKYPERVLESARKYREKNRDKLRAYEKNVPAERKRNRKLKHLYGITNEDYKRLFREQGGVCAICHCPYEGSGSMPVDHDHLTDRVRGLLCDNCNHGLGNFKDDILRLESAIEYLKRS